MGYNLFDYDDEELSANDVTPEEPTFPRIATKEPPSWRDYLEAAAWRTNISARFIGPHWLEEEHSGPNQAFDLKNLENTKYAQYAPSFLNAATTWEADNIKQRIDKDLETRELLQSLPLLEEIGVNWAAGILDPVQDAAAIASTMVSRAVVGAAVAALPFTVPAAVTVGATVLAAGAIGGAIYDVAIKKSLEATSYIDEEELTFKDTMHAALMSGSFAGVSHVSYKAIGKLWDRAIGKFYAFLRPKPGPGSSAQGFADAFSSRALDGVVGNDKVTDFTHRFVLKTLGRFSPANRIAVKGSTKVQETLQDLIVTNFQQEENWHGRPTPVAAEAIIARATDFYNKVFDNIYTKTFIDSGYKDRDAFDVEIYKAYVTGGMHTDPIIAKGAQHLLREVGSEIQEALQKTGVLELNLTLPNAQEYVAVLYDREKIKYNRQSFNNIILNYLTDEDKKARAVLKRVDQQSLFLEQQKLQELGDPKIRATLRSQKENLIYAHSIAPSQALADQITDLNKQIKGAYGAQYMYLKGLRQSKQALLKQHAINFGPQLITLKQGVTNDIRNIRSFYNTQITAKEQQKKHIIVTNKNQNRAVYQHLLDTLDQEIKDLGTKRNTDIRDREKKFYLDKKHLMKAHMQNLSPIALRSLSGMERLKATALGDKAIRKNLRTQRKPLTEAYRVAKDVRTKEQLKIQIDALNQQIATASGTHGQKRMQLIEQQRTLRAEKKEAESRLISPDNVKHAANLLSSSLATRNEGINKIELKIQIPGRKPGTYKKERVVTIPQELMTDYLDTNFPKIMQQYIRKSMADVVLASKFGRHDTLSGTETHKAILKEMDDLIRQYPEHIDEIRKVYADNIEDLEATFQRARYQVAPGAWNWNIDWRIQMGLKAARSYTAVCLLGQSAFSLIPDFASAVMVRGFTSLMTRSISRLTWHRSMGKLARQELRALNVGCRNTLNGTLARDFSDLIGDATKQYGKLAKVYQVFNAANYVQQLANGSLLVDGIRARLIEMTVQQDTLWLCKRVATGKAKQKDIARLASIGIDQLDALKIHKMVKLHGDGKAGYAGVDKWSDRTLANTYGNALQTYVMKYDVSTSHIDQPLIYDNPLINCIMQFSAWSFTLVNKLLAQGTQLGWGLLGPTIIAGIALGIFANELKYQEKTYTGVWKKKKERTNADIILSGVETWGGAGLIGQMGGKFWRSVEHPGGALREAGGPIAGGLQDFFMVAHGLQRKIAEGKSLTAEEIRAVNNLLPFSKYFVVDAVLAEIEGIRIHGD